MWISKSYVNKVRNDIFLWSIAAAVKNNPPSTLGANIERQRAIKARTKYPSGSGYIVSTPTKILQNAYWRCDHSFVLRNAKFYVQSTSFLNFVQNWYHYEHVKNLNFLYIPLDNWRCRNGHTMGEVCLLLVPK